MEIKTQTRAEELDAFLSEINAIHVARLQGKGFKFEIDVMIANGKPLIVQTFWDSSHKTLIGWWDIFIPANSERSVQKTKDAVKEYLTGTKN